MTDDDVPTRRVATIATTRLRLRPLSLADVPALVAYRGDPEVCRYLPFDPMDEARLRTRLAGDLGGDTLPAEGGGLTLGVELIAPVAASDGRPALGGLIGDVVLFHTSKAHRQGEVGYVFNPVAAGRGLATEAVAAMIDLAFDEQDGLGLHRVVARIDVRNRASIRLVERLRLRPEGVFRHAVCDHGQWADLAIFAVLASEWTTTSSAGSARARSRSERSG